MSWSSASEASHSLAGEAGSMARSRNLQRNCAHWLWRVRVVVSGEGLSRCETSVWPISNRRRPSARTHISRRRGSVFPPCMIVDPAMGSVSHSFNAAGRTLMPSIVSESLGSLPLPAPLRIMEHVRSTASKSGSERPLTGHGLEAPMTESLAISLPGLFGPRKRWRRRASTSLSRISWRHVDPCEASASSTSPYCPRFLQWCDTEETRPLRASMKPSRRGAVPGVCATVATATVTSLVKTCRTSSTGHVTTPPSSQHGSSPSVGMTEFSRNQAAHWGIASSLSIVPAQLLVPSVSLGCVSECITLLYMHAAQVWKTSSDTGLPEASICSTRSSTKPLKPSSKRSDRLIICSLVSRISSTPAAISACEVPPGVPGAPNAGLLPEMFSLSKSPSIDFSGVLMGPACGVAGEEAPRSL
mmetsp:Transcript_7140/g.18170  ORF Transcript_7140/g.18170 Transcript_7140/m.18170 type:complete len:415 (+) Transcript_7140:751-1995(+)